MGSRERPEEAKKMMQEEYEAMVGHDVDYEHYTDIEYVYVHSPMFNCPDDVRQFVRRKGGEEMMDAMAQIAHEARVSEERASAAESEARVLRQNAEDDKNTIVDLTRRAREAERCARSAEEQCRGMKEERDGMALKLESILSIVRGASA